MSTSLSDIEIYVSINQTLPPSVTDIDSTHKYLLQIGHTDNYLRRLFEKSNIILKTLDPPHKPPTQPSLTPEQVTVIKLLLDIAKPTPILSILGAVGIPSQVFNTWMEDYYFRDIYSQVLFKSFDKARLLALTNLLSRASHGDVLAINMLSSQFSTNQMEKDNESSSPLESNTRVLEASPHEQ